MVAVFSIFATLSTIDMKQAGVGLAAAILIDATIVRAVLLPSAMKLLGDWNWYLPSWLEWLPQVSHETEALRGRLRLRRPPVRCRSLGSPPPQARVPSGGAGLSLPERGGGTRGGARCGGAPPRRPWAYEPGERSGSLRPAPGPPTRSSEGTPFAA